MTVMGSHSKTTRVMIFGQEYTIKGDEDSEYIEKLAQCVDGRIRQVARRTPGVSSTKAAVLAALNIVDELEKLRAKKSLTEKSMQTKIEGLIELVEDELVSKR